MNNHVEISLIIPCYNEEKNIALFFQTVCDVMTIRPEIHYELIFINDGSSDNTLLKLIQLQEDKKNNISIINFSRNFGKEAAMLAGLKEARGSFLCIIDVDMQQHPRYVMEMYDFLITHNEYDCVAAFQEQREEGTFLTFCKKQFYKLINRISEVKFVNGASDFRMFHKYMAKAIIDLPESNRFSKGIFSWVGFHTHYFPYEVAKRANGSSSWSFWKLLKYAIEGLTSFTTVPLRISTCVGFGISLTAFIYLIIVVIQKIFLGIEIEGYATIIGLILLLGGIQLLVLGVIGEYLAKAYLEVKKRPPYIIKETMKVKKEEDIDD